jgi:dephospho-CoA kinase
MIFAGLTGSISTGKSSVCSIFKGLQIPVIDTDMLARDIVRLGEEGWLSVVQVFGNGILLPDGNVDREKLGRIIFADKTARDELNNCLHPLIINKLLSDVEKLKKSMGGSLIIADIPLLIECGMQKYFDKIILVNSDRETQIRRLIKRNNLTIEDAEKRVNSQMPIEEKRKFADFIIDNCGSFEDLEVKARDLFFKLAES